MSENNHPINEVLQTTMNKIREMVDANTVVGQPIVTQSGGTAVKMTEMLALNIYSTYNNSSLNAHGTAQAKAVIFFILVAGLGLAQLAYTRNKEVQQ